MTETPQQLIAWKHVDIYAPYQIKLDAVRSMDLGRGTAMTAHVLHPTLGLIGWLRDHGDGGGPRFEASDPSRFSIGDLMAYAQQCTEAGEPLRADLEYLLIRMLNEETYETHVRRSHALRANALRFRNQSHSTMELLHTTAPLLHHGQRASVLRCAPDQSVDGCWEVFTGARWVPLDPAVAQQHEAGFPHTKATAKALAARQRIHLSGSCTQSVPHLPEQYQFMAQRWCQCVIGDRSAVTCFEFLTTRGQFAGHAWMHDIRRCRGLIMAE